MFNEFSEKTDDSIENLTKQINDLKTLQQKTEGDLRGLITDKEKGLQKQIDEIRALSNRLSEEFKVLQVDMEELKAIGELTLPKDGQPSVSARGSIQDIRKSTSQNEALASLQDQIN